MVLAIPIVHMNKQTILHSGILIHSKKWAVDLSVNRTKKVLPSHWEEAKLSKRMCERYFPWFDFLSSRSMDDHSRWNPNSNNNYSYGPNFNQYSNPPQSHMYSSNSGRILESISSSSLLQSSRLGSIKTLIFLSLFRSLREDHGQKLRFLQHFLVYN